MWRGYARDCVAVVIEGVVIVAVDEVAGRGGTKCFS